MRKIALLLALLLLLGCLTACGEEETLSAEGVDSENAVPTESIPLPGEIEGMLDADHCTGENHIFATEVLSEVGCETYGELQHTCTICGWYYFEMVMATGHDYNPPTCEFDAYCTICHMNVETATGHNIVDGFCTNCGLYVE